MVTTKAYDLLNRLTNIASSASAFSSSFSYQYNSANQRTKRTDVDGSYWIYTYDSLGQVTSGKRYWSDGTPVAGQQFEYAFDDIGNRTSTGQGGDQNGSNLRSASYSANSLNQYTSRSIPSYVDIQGEAASNATVTIWNSDGTYTPTCRKGTFYRGELPVTNSVQPLWLTITNLAVLNSGTNADIVTNSIGNDFVPKSPESFAYDLDGNLTNDGRFAYSWDGENRLVAMKANTSIGSQISLRFDYDWQGRRIQKRVYSDAGWTTATNSIQFIYDGWNLQTEADGSHLPLRSYFWGLDLGGSTRGDGGIGAVLVERDDAGGTGSYLATYDANGSITALVGASSGSGLADYDYTPFGVMTRSTGRACDLNPLGFSTKYHDRETRLVYYGYRYCDPQAGRWLGADPLEETGGRNLYAMCKNDPVGAVDLLGLILVVPPLSETHARAVLSAVLNHWKSLGWDFAAANLQWFYDKKGPQDRVGSLGDSDAMKIKRDSRFRDSMKNTLQAAALTLCAKCKCKPGGGGRYGEGHFDMRFDGFDELFYALGGAHFDYDGDLRVKCPQGLPQGLPSGASIEWSWRGRVTQKDYYEFHEFSPGNFLSEAYQAGVYLEQDLHYQAFNDIQMWDDEFQN